MSELVTSREISGPQFILLNPGNYPARTGDDFQRMGTIGDIYRTTTEMQKSRILAVDFETQGGDYSLDIGIVGIGLAWDTGSIYFHMDALTQNKQEYLLAEIRKHPGTIAHNVYFDGGVMRKVTGEHAQWHMCTYTLLAMLANESPEQRWGLKEAMVSLLGWSDSNESELDEWLVTNGWYRGARRKDNSLEYLLAEAQSGGLKPDKGEMWRAPADILGKYCALDAEATYLLFTEVLEPVYREFEGLQAYLPEFMGHIRMHIDQRISGIEMDRAALLARSSLLPITMEEYARDFVTEPAVALAIAAIEADMVIKGIVEKEPAQYKKAVPMTSKQFVEAQNRYVLKEIKPGVYEVYER